MKKRFVCFPLNRALKINTAGLEGVPSRKRRDVSAGYSTSYSFASIFLSVNSLVQPFHTSRGQSKVKGHAYQETQP